MATFRYRARTGEGELKDGSIEAATEDVALDKLEEAGMFPVAIKETEGESEETGGEEYPLAERRSYQRVNDRIKFQYMTYDSGPVVPAGTAFDSGADTEQEFRQPTTTINISGDGAYFSSDNAIPKNTVLDIKIDLPDGEGPIECVAKVERLEEPKGGGYGIAISFLNMALVDRSRIDRHVKSKL